jgi:amino-acid N-acetyltransferase
VRPARDGDVDDILALIAPHAAVGAMLPRSHEQVVADLPAYVVVCDRLDRVRGCAALYEYSPSLAEVGSVAVAAGARRAGLGSLAVRGVEALARQRGIDELFALSSSQGFFESLGYERTSVARYPEKLARHAALRALGVEIAPRTCYRRGTESA